MTPSARVAAAIEVLDGIASGLAAEQALTRWARQSRFAGSKDRAAVRDHVYDVLRRRKTAAALGGGQTGRALMIGLLRQQGAPLHDLFSGQGYGPAVLTPEEEAEHTPLTTAGDLLDLPDWIIPEFERSLGAAAQSAARALQERAPVTLRVNLRKSAVAEAQDALRAEGIEVVPNPLSPTALTVTEGARRIRNSSSFSNGYVELQDAASQAVVDLVPGAERCLDYCAGGGGKALALAAHASRHVFAHDIAPDRMKDLSARAERAGCVVPLLETAALSDAGPFDVVLCDAPCSGSGAWRRAPEGKWTLTQERLNALTDLQDDILIKAAGLVAAQGTLAYATCSVLRCENEDRVAAFLASNPAWICRFERRFDLSSHGDGFYTAHLTRT